MSAHGSTDLKHAIPLPLPCQLQSNDSQYGSDSKQYPTQFMVNSQDRAKLKKNRFTGFENTYENASQDFAWQAFPLSPPPKTESGAGAAHSAMKGVSPSRTTHSLEYLPDQEPQKPSLSMEKGGGKFALHDLKGVQENLAHSLRQITAGSAKSADEMVISHKSSSASAAPHHQSVEEQLTYSYPVSSHPQNHQKNTSQIQFDRPHLLPQAHLSFDSGVSPQYALYDSGASSASAGAPHKPHGLMPQLLPQTMLQSGPGTPTRLGCVEASRDGAHFALLHSAYNLNPGHQSFQSYAGYSGEGLFNNQTGSISSAGGSPFPPNSPGVSVSSTSLMPPFSPGSYKRTEHRGGLINATNVESGQKATYQRSSSEPYDRHAVCYGNVARSQEYRPEYYPSEGQRHHYHHYHHHHHQLLQRKSPRCDPHQVHLRSEAYVPGQTMMRKVGRTSTGPVSFQDYSYIEQENVLKRQTFSATFGQKNNPKNGQKLVYLKRNLCHAHLESVNNSSRSSGAFSRAPASAFGKPGVDMAAENSYLNTGVSTTADHLGKQQQEPASCLPSNYQRKVEPTPAPSSKQSLRQPFDWVPQPSQSAFSGDMDQAQIKHAHYELTSGLSGEFVIHHGSSSESAVIQSKSFGIRLPGNSLPGLLPRQSSGKFEADSSTAKSPQYSARKSVPSSAQRLPGARLGAQTAAASSSRNATGSSGSEAKSEVQKAAKLGRQVSKKHSDSLKSKQTVAEAKHTVEAAPCEPHDREANQAPHSMQKHVQISLKAQSKPQKKKGGTKLLQGTKETPPTEVSSNDVVSSPANAEPSPPNDQMAIKIPRKLIKKDCRVVKVERPDVPRNEISSKVVSKAQMSPQISIQIQGSPASPSISSESAKGSKPPSAESGPESRGSVRRVKVKSSLLSVPKAEPASPSDTQSGGSQSSDDLASPSGQPETAKFQGIAFITQTDMHQISMLQLIRDIPSITPEPFLLFPPPKKNTITISDVSELSSSQTKLENPNQERSGATPVVEKDTETSSRSTLLYTPRPSEQSALQPDSSASRQPQRLPEVPQISRPRLCSPVPQKRETYHQLKSKDSAPHVPSGPRDSQPSMVPELGHDFTFHRSHLDPWVDAAIHSSLDQSHPLRGGSKSRREELLREAGHSTQSSTVNSSAPQHDHLFKGPSTDTRISGSQAELSALHDSFHHLNRQRRSQSLSRPRCSSQADLYDTRLDTELTPPPFSRSMSHHSQSPRSLTYSYDTFAKKLKAFMKSKAHSSNPAINIESESASVSKLISQFEAKCKMAASFRTPEPTPLHSFILSQFVIADLVKDQVSQMISFYDRFLTKFIDDNKDFIDEYSKFLPLKAKAPPS